VSDAESFNEYLYADGAPLGRIDPLGQSWWNPVDWAKAICREMVKPVSSFINRNIIQPVYQAVVLPVARAIENGANFVGRTMASAAGAAGRLARRLGGAGVAAATSRSVAGVSGRQGRARPSILESMQERYSENIRAVLESKYASDAELAKAYERSRSRTAKAGKVGKASWIEKALGVVALWYSMAATVFSVVSMFMPVLFPLLYSAQVAASALAYLANTVQVELAYKRNAFDEAERDRLRATNTGLFIIGITPYTGPGIALGEFMLQGEIEKEKQTYDQAKD
jgi:hypothetical protein